MEERCWGPLRSLAIVAISLLLPVVVVGSVGASEAVGDQGSALARFEEEVKPILESRCLKCHGRGKYRGGFSIETREALLAGGEFGPAVVVGQSDLSDLIDRVESDEEGYRMPDDGERLSASEVAALRRWVDDGLYWPEGFSFGFRRAPLAPRTPDVPEATPGLTSDNPIDRFVAHYWAEQGFEIAWTPVSDRTFARRASLDLVGLLPDLEQLEVFEGQSDPEKRTRYVERLLADRRGYADHWLTFWNDLLRNAYRGTGFIDDGRDTITTWLYRALYENVPYDRFVHELIRPVPGSKGFTKGIVWRGVVNASQAPPVQAAQNVSQVFLGTNLKCASCHDSFVNHWKLDDAYGLASVFAEAPLEINRCDVPTGRISEVRFIYKDLGVIEADVPRKRRLEQLADLMVSPENGRLTRTIVNRLWERLMGRGIVEPLDDLDQEPWSGDLLDWLASDLVAHGYDLKRTLRLIGSSQVYQQPSVGSTNEDEAYRFRGPHPRRMNAEQFLDAFATITGVWPEPEPAARKVDGRGQGGQLQVIPDVIGEPESSVPIRASLRFNDPLASALGRPNREQVVTRRDSIASMIQALELTNGEQFGQMLRKGAERLHAEANDDSDATIDLIFGRALGRRPNASEQAVAVELVGDPPTQQGIEDLLWTVLMLPEFQIID